MNSSERKRVAPPGIHRATKERRPFSVFAADVLCHLRVAELLAWLGYQKGATDEVVDGAMSCDSLLARLGRLRRRQLGRAPLSKSVSGD